MIGGSAKVSLSKSNIIQLQSDLYSLVEHYRSLEDNSNLKNTICRSVIIYLAFYIECLSNAVFDEAKKTLNDNEQERKIIDKYNKQSDLPKSIRKLKVGFLLLKNKEYPMNVEGVTDIFLIRNKIFAHAKPNTVIHSTNHGEITKLTYKKFVDFPNFYGDFGLVHAEILLLETVDFLSIYEKHIANSIPSWLKEQFNIKFVKPG